MSVRKLGVALLAVLVLGAIAANNAFAENEFDETRGSAWYTNATEVKSTETGGTKLAEGSTRELTSSKTTTVALQLKSTVGGEELLLEAGGVECKECKIKNNGSVAEATGSLKFTSVKLLKPKPEVCSTNSTLTTEKLKASVRMKKGSSTVTTVKFVPETGSLFVLVEILGASCSVKGTYKVAGAAYGEALDQTGDFTETQELNFSEAIQKSAGTEKSLTFGANPAYILGSVDNQLVGTPKFFGAREK